MYITKYIVGCFKLGFPRYSDPHSKNIQTSKVAGKSRATPVIVQSGLIIISHCFTVKFP